MLSYLASTLRIDVLEISFEQLWLPTFLASVGLLMLQGPILGLRWAEVLRILDEHVSTKQLVAASFIGLFFNQALPSSVGGDAIRIWHISRSGVPTRTAVSSVINERLTGLAVLLVIVIAGTPFLWANFDTANVRLLWALVVCGALAGLAVFVALDRLPPPLATVMQAVRVSDLSRDFRVLATAGRSTLVLAVLGLASWAAPIAAVVLLSSTLGVDVASGYYIVIVPMIILIMVLPISIGGWGVREGAFVVLLGELGVRAADAFVLSVLFGAALILASLPGSVLWLKGRSENAGIERNERQG